MAPTTSNPSRKAELIKEARALGVTVTLTGTAEEIDAEIVASGKRTAPQPLAPEAPHTPSLNIETLEPDSLEGDDDFDDVDFAKPTLDEQLSKALQEREQALGLVAGLRKEVQELREDNFRLESEKSRVEAELFDIKESVPEELWKKEKTADDDVEEFELSAPVKKKPSASASKVVTVRITKMGDGKVCTGEPNKFFKRNDTPSFPYNIARSLEQRGFAEID